MQIRYELIPEAKRGAIPKDQSKLGFGKLRTDHVFLIDYKDGVWKDPRIVPYGHICLAPGAMCFHYGQTLFEGGKAFQHPDGELYAFRFDLNARRVNHSASILSMPSLEAAIQEEALHRLLDIERNWCPTVSESSMYIRPFMIATEDALGVRPSTEYTYCIMLSPSGPYYPDGFSKPVRLLVSETYHRAVGGGPGAAKTGGNYVASMRAAEYAASRGCAQVLYLTADNKCIEEAGAMNHYHVLADGTFIIPKFTDTLLESITSLSVLELAAAGKIKARQETVLLTEFLEGVKSGAIVEAGGFGTAAVVSPVGSYMLEDGTVIQVGDGNIGKYSRQLYELYSSIQTGKTTAPAGWLKKIEHYK